MTQEQIESLARYATDSYFANLEPRTKDELLSSQERYLEAYTKVYMKAVETVTYTLYDTLYEEQTRNDLASQFKTL